MKTLSTSYFDPDTATDRAETTGRGASGRLTLNNEAIALPDAFDSDLAERRGRRSKGCENGGSVPDAVGSSQEYQTSRCGSRTIR